METNKSNLRDLMFQFIVVLFLIVLTMMVGNMQLDINWIATILIKNK